MIVDQKGELPAGFVWQELPGINARIPIPNNWFFLDSSVSITKLFEDDKGKYRIPGFDLPLTAETSAQFLFHLSRESIPQRGIMTSGVAFYGFTEFDRSMGGSAVEFARGIFKKHPVFQPVGGLTETEDPPLVVCRRRFILPVERWMTILSYKNELITKQMPPTHLSCLAAGNQATDTAYLITFETPSVKWKDDKPIAEIMINNVVFDKQV